MSILSLGEVVVPVGEVSTVMKKLYLRSMFSFTPTARQIQIFTVTCFLIIY